MQNASNSNWKCCSICSKKHFRVTFLRTTRLLTLMTLDQTNVPSPVGTIGMVGACMSGSRDIRTLILRYAARGLTHSPTLHAYTLTRQFDDINALAIKTPTKLLTCIKETMPTVGKACFRTQLLVFLFTAKQDRSLTGRNWFCHLGISLDGIKRYHHGKINFYLNNFQRLDNISESGFSVCRRQAFSEKAPLMFLAVNVKLLRK